MNCIVCDGKTRITESRLYGGITYRRHLCKECGKLFFTEEHVISDKVGKHALYKAVDETYPEKKKKRYTYKRDYKALYQKEKQRWLAKKALEMKLESGETETQSHT